MTPEIGKALIDAGAVVVAALAVLIELSKQRTERVDQRAAIRNAVDAEVNRVRDILLRQFHWLDEHQTDPLNWLPIQTQVWDGLAAQIGSLEAQEAGDLTRFFGFVRWYNEVLKLRDGAFKNNDQGFLETYRKAFRSVAENLPRRFHTPDFTRMLKSYAPSKIVSSIP